MFHKLNNLMVITLKSLKVELYLSQSNLAMMSNKSQYIRENGSERLRSNSHMRILQHCINLRMPQNLKLGRTRKETQVLTLNQKKNLLIQSIPSTERVLGPHHLNRKLLISQYRRNSNNSTPASRGSISSNPNNHLTFHNKPNLHSRTTAVAEMGTHLNRISNL